MGCALVGCEILNREQFTMKGLHNDRLIRGGKNTVQQIQSNMMVKSRLKGFFLSLILEGEVTTLLEGLLVL